MTVHRAMIDPQNMHIPGYWDAVCKRAIDECRHAIPPDARVLKTDYRMFNNPNTIMSQLEIRIMWEPGVVGPVGIQSMHFYGGGV